jgi:SAM domain (Sterile alpha motif)/Adenylate and Guanylate cyclase catalytic domain
MQQIADWLEKLGVAEYAERFAENDIDFSILPELTDQDLEKIGVRSLGHRRKILRAIAAFASAATVVPPALSASSPAPKPTPAVGASPPTPLAAAEAAGERRYLTVMFCDLVGSTAISAQLDAEEWRDLVGAYLDAASAAVAEMGGHVAKKLGDGLMALFGYPTAHENDAERAVRAALSIQRALGERNRKHGGSGKPELIARIGLRRWWTRRARFTATSLTLPRGYSRSQSRVRCWSPRGCSARSLDFLWPKSAARIRSKVCPSRRVSTGSFARAAVDDAPDNAS